MKIISTREQLFTYIAGHIAYKYIAEAVSDGVVENLGAFHVRGGDGWIVKVQAALSFKSWYVGITICDRRYKLILTDVPPGWKYWVGDISEHELYRGDNPDKYAQLREKEIANVKD